MNQDNPIEQIMSSAMSKLKTLVDVNTVVGLPISQGSDTVVIPLSKVSMGFVAGGGEYSDKSNKKDLNFPFAGGSGAGMSVSPVGFLVFSGDNVKIVTMEDKSAFEKIMDTLPVVVKGVTEHFVKEKE